MNHETRNTKQKLLHAPCSMLHEQGFTLIELIIVIAITALISTISIANFRRGEKQKQVQLAADIVVNTIRNAQNYALAGKATNNSDANCRVVQYYFANLAYPTTLTLKARNNCGSDDLIQTYPFPVNTKVRVGGLVLDGSAATNSLVIQFVPPFAQIKASRDGAQAASFVTASVTVESTDGAVFKTTIIDGVSGRIGE